jgi:hypothetical protein
MSSITQQRRHAQQADHALTAPTHKTSGFCDRIVVNLFALPSGGFLLRDPLHAHSYGDRDGNSLRTMRPPPSRRSKKLSNGCA